MQFVDYKVKTATRKACSSIAIPPKPKHIRTIIIKSYNGGIPTFYTEIIKFLQSSNMIQQYKALDTLHRVLIEGSNHLIMSYLEILLQIINKLVNQQPTIMKNIEYRQLNKHYLKYIQLRLTFHQKNRIIQTNLSLPDSHEVPEEYYNDQKCLMVISYIMDLMDYLLVLPLPIIQNYSYDNCRLDCCIPLILDSFMLYSDIIFFMTNLAHIDQHQSVFAFLFDRLKKLHLKLTDLYDAARQNKYISSLIEVPYLPPLPEFKITEAEKKKYMMKHPHSVSSNSSSSKSTSEFHHHLQNEEKERKTQQQSLNNQTRKELMNVGKEFIDTASLVLNSLIPESINPMDVEYVFYQMITSLKTQLNSFSLDEMEIALWKTLMESRSILNETNIERCIMNKSKEKAINALYNYQGIATKMSDLLMSIDNKEEKMNEFYQQIEDFINALITYETTMNVKNMKWNNNLLDLFDFTTMNNYNEFTTEGNDYNDFNNEEDNDTNDDETDEENVEEFENDEIHQNNEEMNKIYNVIEVLHHHQNDIHHQHLPFIHQFEHITNQLLELLKTAEECEKERIQNGKEQSTNLYYQNEVWEEGLLSCAKKIVEWVQFIADCIEKELFDEQMIVALKQFKSFCSQLESAAKVSMNESSQKLHQLEYITKTLRKEIDEMIHSLGKTQQKESQHQIQMKEQKLDGVESKKQLMESEIKVLQLQKELENAQQELYSLRKKEYH